MFSFKGKNTKMVMCFLTFLFFGFILFNLLGKNMEGFKPPGFGCYDNGVVRDRNRKVIECNDRNPIPNTGIINSCNPSIRDRYICRDTGRMNFQNNMPPSRVQWTKV